MELKELKEELNRVGIMPVDIKHIDIKNKRYQDQCIYLLYFLKKDNIKISTLRQTTGVFNMIIRWEYYTLKVRGPTQCSKCQDFGHGAENCYKDPKCVRCGDLHKSDSCPHLPEPLVDDQGNELPGYIAKIPVAKVKCANCKQNHTSNFKGCTSRQEYLQIQQRVRTNLKHHRQVLISPSFNDTNQFPPLRSHTNFNHSIRPTHSPSFAQQLSSPTNDLFSAQECYQIFNELLEKLSRSQTKHQQMQVIGEVTFKYLYGSAY